MSTFEGKLLEDSLDFIRIDQFEPKNHNGTAFFLSHFHTDHFQGIFTDKFLKVLVENEDKMLYCTALTKKLILAHVHCRIPENKIFAMTVNAPYLLMCEDHLPVQVIALPAGHCPGSAMFLFEQETVRVLYTGDFRIDPNELHKFKALHNSDGSVKRINTLYLDTTFCDRRWVLFPSRKQTEEDLTEVARDWLERNPDYQVGILYNSYHGLEPLLMRLAKSLKTKIFVRDPQSFNNYSCIAELEPSLCRSEKDSRVHLCSVKEMERCQLCCGDRNNIKTIKPCAMSFNSDQLELGSQKEEKSGLVRIAYSMHCSLEELIGTVNYLEPNVVHPCALPRNVSAQQVLKNLLLDVEELKKELQEKKENRRSSWSASPPAKKFCFSQSSEEREERNMLWRDRETVVPLRSSDNEEDIPLSQNSIDSPPL